LGGLIAIDIDGHRADARYRGLVGDAYEAAGKESTMSWASGKPGCRQILYPLPDFAVRDLEHVTKLIYRLDGT